MNVVSKNIALAIFVIVVAQCGSKGNVQTVKILPPEFSDPYFNSFRNKNIKYIIFERIGLKDFIDTIELDRRGNVVRINGYGEEEKRAYDVNDFLVRRRLRSDVTMNYVARYSIRGDTLVQSWRQYKSNDWDLRGDTTTRLHGVNFFVYDQNGRVIEEFIEGLGASTYIYSKNRLTHKEIEIRRNYEEELHTEKAAKFTYEDNGRIKEIKLSNGRGEEKLLYYSVGLPDSCNIITSYDGSQSWLDRYKYRYVYY